MKTITEQKVEKIAQRHLGVETLETRRMDDLDFHDLSVWQLKAALEAAYEAGRRASASTGGEA